MGSTTRPTRSLAKWIAAVVLVGAIAATSVDAGEPPDAGFTDGQWEGDIAWDATLQFEDVLGYGDSRGEFSVTYQGGLPTGTFKYEARDVVGATDVSRAELLITSFGYFTQTTDGVPLLVPQRLSVAGEVLVYGIDRFPVEFPIEGELGTVRMDISRAGCATVSGTFKTDVAAFGERVLAEGGSLSVQNAHWAARRVGDAGTSAQEQNDTTASLLEDGVAVLQAIDAGTVDRDALQFLIHRAERIAEQIKRNVACDIDNPGLSTTVVAGLVTQILTKMAANQELFDVGDFRVAVLAGLESGALGSNAGASDDQLVVELKNALREKFAAAAAVENRQDLADIATVAYILGDDELVALAVAELKKK